MTHPCDDGCQYAKDIGMWPEHSCGNGCMYDKHFRSTSLPTGSDMKEQKAQARQSSQSAHGCRGAKTWVRGRGEDC